MSVETPIVRVFRRETWLTIYRSIAVLSLHCPLEGPYFHHIFVCSYKCLRNNLFFGRALCVTHQQELRFVNPAKYVDFGLLDVIGLNFEAISSFNVPVF